MPSRDVIHAFKAMEAKGLENWFHGFIDRKESEKRLLETQTNNCFLIRESRDSQRRKSFVVSLRTRSTISHFRVHYICGNFYLGGKAFKDLQEIVACYTTNDLLKGIRLQNPIPPPNHETVADPYSQRRLLALLPYQRVDGTDEISFSRGDSFLIQNDLQNGWLWATNLTSGDSGLVFSELLAPEYDYPWFHHNISKEEAVALLSRAGKGSFLVRPSERSRGDFSLFVSIGESIQRFRIERLLNGFRMGGRLFSSLETVIQRYQMEEIVEGFRLERPIVRLEEKNEEMIYQTIRESRDKPRDSLLSAFLQKKGKKKWKTVFALLDEKECTLALFHNEKRVKPKAIVDLTYACVYQIHDSLFERANCFQVVERALPCLSTVYYLSSNSCEQQKQWIRTLETLCSSQRERDQHFRRLRTLHVTLIEGRNLPIKLVSSPCVEIRFEGFWKIARSQAKCPPNPIWEEDFLLDLIPNDVKSVSLVLQDSNKRKDCDLAETSIHLNQIQTDFTHWFSLSGLAAPVRDSWGSIRARIRFKSEILLQFQEYRALQQLILSEDLLALQTVESLALNHTLIVAQSVLKIARYNNRELQLIRALIERECRVESETQSQELFRSSSMTTSLVELYLRETSLQWIRQILHEPLIKTFESKSKTELNPSRLSSMESACHNAENLLAILDVFVESVFSRKEIPKTLSFVLSCISQSVSRFFPNNQILRVRALSSFVFLRLICKAILNPKEFQLENEIPSESSARTLILVAKTLQSLANLLEFSSKEPWMEVVNPFILKNKSRVIQFLELISREGDPLAPPPTHWTKGQQWEEPTRELATIHTILEENALHLEEMSRSQNSLKKIIIVSKNISKQKQKIITNK